MIKEELLYVHQLLAVTSEHLDEERDVPVPENDYADVDVGPYAFFENKHKHKAAVVALGADVGEASAEALEERGVEAPVLAGN